MYGAGAAFFCLEPEPTQVVRSRSQVRDLGHPELELPKKVTAPQYWWGERKLKWVCQKWSQLCTGTYLVYSKVPVKFVNNIQDETPNVGEIFNFEFKSPFC